MRFVLLICLIGSTISFTAPGHEVLTKRKLNEGILPAACKDNYYSSASIIDKLELHSKEMRQEWEVLFDGKNTSAWKGVKSDTFPSGWKVENGSLFLNKKGAGDLITRKKYSSFELVLEFNLTKNANSGIKYFVGEILNKKTGETSMNGIEYQVIDDFNYPGVMGHAHDAGSTAACYLIYPPKNKKLLPAGEWNSVKIIAKGKKVEHWLNNQMVLQYERGSEDFKKQVATTKFKNHENYGELPEGHILLTDHNDVVYFRNIKIRRL